MSEEIKKGLLGIVVDETTISHVVPELSALTYRGYTVQELCDKCDFEEVAYLVLHGELPNKSQLRKFIKEERSNRKLSSQILKDIKKMPKNAHPMDVLQAFVAALAGYYDEQGSEKEISQQRAINLISKVPTIIASWERVRNDKEPIQPDPELSHASNFLYMLTGNKPDKEMERVFDVCLILHADHTFNASTFAAREVASTRAHMYSAVSAAVGALSGELHGGANYEVMKMLLDIKDENNATNWVKSRIEKGDRIMGMGHAVYKTVDPRSMVLKELSKKLSAKTGLPWYNITKKVEETTSEIMKNRKERDIFPNVDLYSASVYYMLNIPMDLNTPIFAISRVSGWAAHVIEEKFAEAAPKPMLYRPKATYVGKYEGPQGCNYIPIEERK